MYLVKRDVDRSAVEATARSGGRRWRAKRTKQVTISPSISYGPTTILERRRIKKQGLRRSKISVVVMSCERRYERKYKVSTGRPEAEWGVT